MYSYALTPHYPAVESVCQHMLLVSLITSHDKIQTVHFQQISVGLHHV